MPARGAFVVQVLDLVQLHTHFRSDGRSGLDPRVERVLRIGRGSGQGIQKVAFVDRAAVQPHQLIFELEVVEALRAALAEVEQIRAIDDPNGLHESACPLAGLRCATARQRTCFAASFKSDRNSAY